MLDNKAKIKDIIASLQESEGINQKAELKSILVDKGIPVEDTNDMASIVSKVNELKNADLTNLIPDNIKKDVNINGTIGTLESKLNSLLVNVSVYIPVSITSEGLWCQRPDASSNNTLYLFDKLGNLVKTITCSNAYHFFQVSENYILVEYNPSNYTLGIFDHNGTLVKDLNFNRTLNTCVISEKKGCLYLSDNTSNPRIYKYNFSDLSIISTASYSVRIQATILIKRGLYVQLFSGTYFYLSYYDDDNPNTIPPYIQISNNAYLSLFINSLN